MKKQLSFLLFISVFVCLHAQGGLNFTATIQKDYDYTADNEQPPIYNWTNDYSVSFVQDREKCIFNLIDHASFFAIYPTIPPSGPSCNIYHAIVNLPDSLAFFRVNDIYIVDDYAFFCGSIYDTIKHKPYVLYGYFDLNGFFDDTLTVCLDTITDGTTTAPVILERLVAYKHNSKYKVVTYGYDDSHKYKVLEIVDAINPSNSCRVAEMEIPWSDIIVTDILLTNSNVVIVGHDIYQYVIYVCGSRASVVHNITTNYNMILAGDETNGEVKGVALDGDTFALSYVYYDYTDHQYYTRLRVIDGRNNTNYFSYQFAKPDKEDPVKMVYLEDNETIELLQPVYDSGDFVCLRPYVGTSYTTSYLFPDVLEYKTLQKIGGHCFFSFHKNKYYIENRLATLPHSEPTCPSDGVVTVDLIPNILTYGVSPNTGESNTVLPILPCLDAPILILPLNPICFSFSKTTRK